MELPRKKIWRKLMETLKENSEKTCVPKKHLQNIHEEKEKKKSEIPRKKKKKLFLKLLQNC